MPPDEIRRFDGMRQMLASNVGVKCWRQMLEANVGGKCFGFPKYMWQTLASNLCGIVKLLRHITYDRNKADVEISEHIKIYAPNVCVHLKIRAQTLRLLTIWARQNLQLLTSSKSGWRALVQVMLPLHHVVLKWPEHSGLSLCGRRLSRTVPAVVPAFRNFHLGL